MDEAKNWLEIAFAWGDAKKLKMKALCNPDLEALWTEIGGI